MDKYLNKKEYKPNEIILEQYYDIKTNTLWIITRTSDKWTLYNHTQNKKIGSSKELLTLYEKIPN